MNIVAIPTLGKSPLLWSLLESLLDDDVDEVWVYDNGMANDDRERLWKVGEASGDVIMANSAQGESLYGMWNRAITDARDIYGEANLAILNDDVRLAPHTMLYLATALRTSDIGIVCPNYQRPLSARGRFEYTLRFVHGTYRNGGIAGFAFMVRAETCPLIDEQFEIWYGDDDLVAKIEAQGQRACIVEGLPIEHEESTTLNQTDWVPAAIARDRDRWAALGRT